MEGKTMHIIEGLFQEKVFLYADLAECFRKERGCLSGMNIEGLWAVSDQKNGICSQIGALRSRIAFALGLDRNLEEGDMRRFLALIPAQEQGPLRNALLHIMKLKQEVELMRKENRTFIEDSLDFLDEIISLLAGEKAGEIMYSGRSRLQRTEAVHTMSREV